MSHIKMLVAFTLGVVCATALSVLASPGDFTLHGVLTVGASTPFSDSAGTLTLQNVDAIDATTEGVIEAAIDTLDGVTSLNMGASTSILEVPNGTDLPATCAAGELFLDTNDDSCADSNDGSGCLCVCITTNTWAAGT